MTEKKRKDALSEEQLKKIDNFFNRSDLARPIPDKASAGTNKVKHSMECSLKKMHREYQNENPENQVSYSKFVKLKPRNILPMSKNRFMNCLCEYCVNTELCVDALRTFILTKKRVENERLVKERQNQQIDMEVKHVEDIQVITMTDPNLPQDHREEKTINTNENLQEIEILNNEPHQNENQVQNGAMEENMANLSIRDKYELSSLTLCEKENQNYKKKCIDRKCKDCGTKNIDNKLLPLFQNYPDEKIKWAAWERTKYKNAAGKESMRMMKIPKEEPFNIFISQLKQKLEPFSKHIFDARWQAQQFKYISTNVPNKWVVFCADFAENFTCFWQDEAQGAHWSYDQVTLHPFVSYYRCDKDECEIIVEESIVFVSNDHTHDHHAVQHYVKKAVGLLQQNGIDMEKLIQFSDGAPTQYKSKVNFADLSYSLDDYGVPTEKHYFGSRHGKGPCDRETGTIKKSVTLAVKGRSAEVSEAKSFYEHCSKTLSRPKENEDQHVHFKRKFVFVTNGDIKRNRPERQSLRSVKNTRLYHCFRSLEGRVITHRERSCFCDVCLELETENAKCENETLTRQWILTYLTKRSRKNRGQDQEPAADLEPDQEPVSDLELDQEPAADLEPDQEPVSDLELDQEPAADLELDQEPVADLEPDQELAMAVDQVPLAELTSMPDQEPVQEQFSEPVVTLEPISLDDSFNRITSNSMFFDGDDSFNTSIDISMIENMLTDEQENDQQTPEVQFATGHGSFFSPNTDKLDGNCMTWNTPFYSKILSVNFKLQRWKWLAVPYVIHFLMTVYRRGQN